MNRIGNLVKNILILSSLIVLATFFPADSFAFRLPDTGQTLCYDSSGDEIDCTGTGQDGAYNINPMSFTDNADGTVTDKNTGLMWQKHDDGNRHNWYQASGTVHKTHNPTAKDVCGSLTLGSHSDWRLPTKKELMSIADYGIPSPGPMIMTTYFPDAYSAWYWSSTTYAGSPGLAWYMDFNNGDVGDYDKDYIDHVRCVRGGQPSSPDFTDNGNGTVTDNRTGFMWQQGEPGTMTWSSALSYCEGLNLGGNSDWRLPNIKEIESITDDTRYNPAIDTTFFPDAMSDYWSSTTEAGSPGKAWHVFFYGGWGYSDSKSTSFSVRCLRGHPETKPPTGSITIEGGAEATKSTAVTLTLAADDDSPGAIQMCISNTETCAKWTALAATKSWTLTTGDGTKTVNVWFQDMWGNETATPYSDTIILDTVAPTNGTLTATPGNAEVMLGWTGFTDTGSTIESYKVVYAIGSAPTSCSSGTMIYSGTNTTYPHTGLTNGTTYYYRVCAIDKAENMSTGATASAKPIPETKPPTGSITIEGGAEATKSTAVTLTLAATDESSGAIQMCMSNTATCTAWTALAATKSWTLTKGDGTKTVNVWFQDVWGNENAAPYSDTILFDTVSPANGTVTATPGDAQVTLDWTGFTDTGSGIESYKVVFAKGAVPLSCSAGTVIYSGTDPSYIHTRLTNGTKHGYRVCAIDRAGKISTGATASAKPIPETKPPTGSITINGGAEATKRRTVSLNLTAIDVSPGAIRMCISNTETCTEWTAFTATKKWKLTKGDGTKTVNVWFKDVWGNENVTPYSDTILLDTTAPTNGTLTATPGDAQVTLDWTGFTDTGSGIESFKVIYTKGSAPTSCSGGKMIYSGSDTSYIHTGLTNGKKYGYRVCAIDNAGNVSKGATASAKPIP